MASKLLTYDYVFDYWEKYSREASIVPFLHFVFGYLPKYNQWDEYSFNYCAEPLTHTSLVTKRPYFDPDGVQEKFFADKLRGYEYLGFTVSTACRQLEYRCCRIGEPISLQDAVWVFTREGIDNAVLRKAVELSDYSQDV